MNKITIFILSLLILCPVHVFADENNDTSTKKERNFIREGNDFYENSRYRDAEVSYKKALETNPTSEIARYNLASSLMKQSGSAQADSPNNPIVQADSMFRDLSRTADNSLVREKSFYNLGNIAFDKQDFKQSIQMYKDALRINPDNDTARENLRLAQLKLKEQEQNKDKNNDKNKDQQQNQDKDKNDQDKQNNNDNKNDKNNQDKNDQKENKQPNQEQNQQQNKQDKQQSQGISDANAEKILKTMENEENATRHKVNELKKREEEKNASRRQIVNQW